MMETNGYHQDDSGQSSLTPRNAANLAMIETSDHEAVKAALRPVLGVWCEHVVEGVRRNERNANNLFARAMGIAGAQVEVNLHMLATRELGMSIDEARRKISMVASVEGIDEVGAISIMEQHVREFYRSRGKRIVVLDDTEAVAS